MLKVFFYWPSNWRNAYDPIKIWFNTSSYEKYQDGCLMLISLLSLTEQHYNPAMVDVDLYMIVNQWILSMKIILVYEIYSNIWKTDLYTSMFNFETANHMVLETNCLQILSTQVYLFT